MCLKNIEIDLNRTHSIAESTAVIDELGEWNGGARERPRAPRDWTREAYLTGNGNDDGKFRLA